MPENPSSGQGAEEFDAADRSLGELVSEASGNISKLVRLELELAKLELARDAKQVGKGSAMFVAAAVLLHLFLILFSVTAGLFLYDVAGLSAWISFLIVTLFYLLVAAIMVGIGVLHLRKIKGLERFGTTMATSVSVLRGEHTAER
ncbi:phage holin family protein [Nocardiopsis suaedae]|uniref:Phage holin family protein n=1 Tax=Nocardiopsis suaedae TaxID=3018444 RepID=A0ABT4TU83_9ACTN|nr:phage holin family protein [Nocardiopsis suaedae]MDA2808228.1 phage holin family protein [Nocardiopsis suaedae]